MKPAALDPRAGLARSGRRLIGCALIAAALCGCAHSGRTPTSAPLEPAYEAAAASRLRTDEDRAADARRKPVEFLRFAAVRPGMKVLDVSAGGGYTAQLLALAVGPSGVVWAQLDKPRKSLRARLSAHPQANLRELLRSFEDPYPADAPRLDLITFVLNYHDIAYQPIDRQKMDRKLFEALEPGGHLIVIDHSARAGSGTEDCRRLHRIDQALVQRELEAAGFVLEQESSFLRNPADPREQAFFDMQAPTDRFALRFVRPM